MEMNQRRCNEPVYLFLYFARLYIACLAILHMHMSWLCTSILKVIVLSSEYFTLNSDCITYYRSNAFSSSPAFFSYIKYCCFMCGHPFVLLARAARNHGDNQCSQPCSLMPCYPFGFGIQQKGRRLSSFSFALYQPW